MEALRNRQIAGAGVDVFDVEPFPDDHPFRSLDNIVLTGHTGYSTRDNFECMYSQALEDIHRAFRRVESYGFVTVSASVLHVSPSGHC